MRGRLKWTLAVSHEGRDARGAIDQDGRVLADADTEHLPGKQRMTHPNGMQSEWWAAGSWCGCTHLLAASTKTARGRVCVAALAIKMARMCAWRGHGTRLARGKRTSKVADGRASAGRQQGVSRASAVGQHGSARVQCTCHGALTPGWPVVWLLSLAHPASAIRATKAYEITKTRDSLLHVIASNWNGGEEPFNDPRATGSIDFVHSPARTKHPT